ncbi:RT0821/Lpp0805 family surface protein [Sneathiella marina]|uniref:17 kDa surface antigen n=1 Tax=Sneathiella marina TaxID=2950108 RepID=A0ABY4W6V6_9PROT|nr:RT0821/Lpp0805 family surface protein [Sneathiella marina]USG62634.1 RT0821/Lpp0805 family surface protein [Sneathiella marina]
MDSSLVIRGIFRISKVKIVAAAAAIFLFVGIAPAFADPPPWAPAWGYYGKQKGKGKHKYKGKNRQYAVPPAVPFGIGRGDCNRELLGSVLGATIGGVAGSQVGKGSGQLVGVAGGTIIGYLIGGAIGRTMDEIDQNCIGQILEHGEDGQDIVWNNPRNGTVYEVSPSRTYQQSNGEYCREYTAQSDINGQIQTTYGIACRQEDGSWKIKN